MTARRNALPALLASLPSLDLDFLQQGYTMSLVNKAFGDIINFSRASAATRINAAGLIESVAANQPRFDYEPADIPILGGERVSGAWSSATGIAGVGAEVHFSGATGGSSQNDGSAVAGKVHEVTYEIYDYVSGSVKPYLGANSAAQSGNSNGWRTEKIVAGDTRIRFFVSAASANLKVRNVSVREITGYVAQKGTPKGILIEEQRTNFCTYSEDFSNASWTVSAATKTTGIADAFGGVKAATITVDAQNNLHFLLGPAGVSFASGTTYTASVMVKAGGTNRVQLSFPGSAFGVSQYANFGLSGSGSVLASAGVSAKIDPVGNGFYRCQITGTATTTAAGNSIVVGFVNADNATRLPVFTSNGTDSVTVCFGQTEAGAFATSYIPTTSAQVTRAADVATINTLSPWFTAGNGVIYLEHTTFNPAPSSNRVLELSNGGSQERIYIAQRSAVAMRLDCYVAGAEVAALIQTSPGVGSVIKTASRIKTNDFALSTNGLDAITDTSVPAPAGLNVIRLGSANFDLAFLNGHIRKMRYYQKSASNAELKTMSA